MTTITLRQPTNAANPSLAETTPAIAAVVRNLKSATGLRVKNSFVQGANMSERCVIEDFLPYLNEVFDLTAEGIPGIEVQLVEVKNLTKNSGETDFLSPPGAAPNHNSFSLLFKSAPDIAPLQQGIYKFSNKKAGKFSLFIVPLAAHSGGVFYEAVFN